jgi:hypothetical protein
MNKLEANERLSALEAEAKKLRALINNGPEKSKEEVFWELMMRTTSIKIDQEKYPNQTFGFVNDKLLWQYDAENGFLWLSDKDIWSVFEKQYSLKYTDIQLFIKNLVEEHFKFRGVTPLANM